MNIRPSVLKVFASFASFALLAAGQPAFAETRLSWEDIQRTVQVQSAGAPGYRPNDLISRGQVAQVLQSLKSQGWNVPHSDKILADVLPDDDFLVTKSRTDAGRAFLRRIAATPQGYDRLDRLARLPRGQEIVGHLMTDAGGYKMIDYLATAPGGLEMGKMLAADRNGQDFNKPTGKIYTAEQLLARLKRAFERGA